MTRRGPLIYAVVYLTFLYLPILFLPLFSFNDATVVAFPLKGFTTKWYAALLDTETMHKAVWNSLKVAVSAAIVSTILGILAARAITRYRFVGRNAITGFMMIPLVLPEIIVGISLLIVLVQSGIGLSLFSVTLGHILLCIPFSTAVLISSFDGFDRSLEEASLDLGETAFATFFRVTLPLVLPGIISSLLIAFTISLDEFIVAFFLTGTEPTLPIYIWGQLRFPARIPGILALGSLLLAASFTLLCIAEMFRRKSQRNSDKLGGLT